MEEDDIKKLIEEEKQRLAEEERRNNREEKIHNLFNMFIVLAITGLLILIIYLLIPTANDINENVTGSIIVIPNPNSTNISNASAEAERLAALEAERLARESARKLREDLENKCEPLFEKRLSDYDTFIFDNTTAALSWIANETSIRLNKDKSYEDRVDFQIRFVVVHNKIIYRKNIPIAVAIEEEMNYDKFDSYGLVCDNEGMIDFSKAAQDNIIYPIVMRREWV
jgi:hypothetical protein